MRCKNHGGLLASISGHDDTRLCDVCEHGRDSFLSGESSTITIPRDLHELYKEGAEKWAEDQISRFTYGGTEVLRWSCDGCSSNTAKRLPEVHTADCKAARILGLNREGEG